MPDPAVGRPPGWSAAGGDLLLGALVLDRPGCRPGEASSPGGLAVLGEKRSGTPAGLLRLAFVLWYAMQVGGVVRKQAPLRRQYQRGLRCLPGQAVLSGSSLTSPPGGPTIQA